LGRGVELVLLGTAVRSTRRGLGKGKSGGKKLKDLYFSLDISPTREPSKGDQETRGTIRGEVMDESGRLTQASSTPTLSVGGVGRI